MQDPRYNKLLAWLHSQGYAVQNIAPITGDASFRRYFRVTIEASRYIVMDAPPSTGSCLPFVSIAQELSSYNINTPIIFAKNLAQGFLLLSDFGDTMLHQVLNNDTANEWYHRCFETLLLLQQHKNLDSYPLPQYNNGLYSFYEESSWFITWYLQQYRQLSLSHQMLAELEREIHLITTAVKEQPQVVIHRDFHSRNIMVTPEQTLGILDFQDAVVGPITYDLVSLLRDCYINWPPEQVEQWLRDYYQQQNAVHCKFDQFKRWFDWAGLQRHLKCAGLFVRLNLRDHKPSYLQYIPRVVTYIKQVAGTYPELKQLSTLLTNMEAEVTT